MKVDEIAITFDNDIPKTYKYVTRISNKTYFETIERLGLNGNRHYHIRLELQHMMQCKIRRFNARNLEYSFTQLAFKRRKDLVNFLLIYA